MAGGLSWSPRARKDRMSIFSYWNRRNGSNAYSRKLNTLFNSALRSALKFPDSGIVTDHEGVRAVLARDYMLFYRIVPEGIYVMTIFDTRQDPEKLIGRLE
jgi:plasmid stabilization system protein ParE